MPAPERRKIRKGTTSCWECKKRKSRCIFTVSGDEICDGCKRRGTRCVAQHQPDPAASNRAIGRLSRLEAMLEQLMERLPDNTPQLLYAEAARVAQGSQAVSSSTETRSTLTSTSDPEQTSNSTTPQITRTRVLLSPFISPSTGSFQTARHDVIRRRLIEAWPCQRDLEAITSFPFDLEESSHGLVSTICISDLDPKSQVHELPRRLFQLPPSGSHPVLYAQRLLILASCLQTTAPPEMASPIRDLMHGAVEAARVLVNANDDMVASIEGVECIAIESMHHCYAGDLRRGWLTLRRAMMIAQTMGLHQRVYPSSAISMNPCRPPSRSNRIWFILVHLDRYLCLMLGLPQCSSESAFASREELEVCGSEEKLQRLDCALAGRILHLKDSTSSDFGAILEGDKILHQAKACMPSAWWASSCIRLRDKTDESGYLALLKDQVRHYHLLSQLHWVSLLSSESDPKTDYSRVTAVNASREALSRCITLNNTRIARYHFPALIRISFMASTALCLANMLASRYGEHSTWAALQSHQRPSDRGMLEQALEDMERWEHLDSHMASVKISSVLGQLLTIDADGSNGTKYDFRFLPGGSYHDTNFDGRLLQDGKGLQIDTPLFGTILIERLDETCSGATGATCHPSEPPPTSDWHGKYHTVEDGGTMMTSYEALVSGGVNCQLEISGQEWLPGPAYF